MRMYDIIMRKRNGSVLSEEEIRFMIHEYVAGNIPDYQMSAMLMAIYFRGMSDEETSILTDAMAHSGEMVDLSAINGITIDKHSTGGVGDKTSLILAPIVAACGGKVAKMSGRGLGHTGGTIDKMEAIPGLQTSLPQDKFIEIVNKIGFSVIGQSGNLAPADKKLYALRDVTATVDSIPLIAASIMSKKLAAGNDCILLDVKTGSGAFMKTLEGSIELAKKMVAIGENAGKKTVALITDMDIPLGHAIGNALEIIEVVTTLHNQGPADLTKVSLELAANMLHIGGFGTPLECMTKATKAIEDGSAYLKLIEMVEAQGGDSSVIKDISRFAKAPFEKIVTAPKTGYINHMNTEQCGIASLVLGAGRETKESTIDYSAGIILKNKVGDYVKAGDELAVLYTSKEETLKEAEKILLYDTVIDETPVKQNPLIFARVDKEKVDKFI
ncbi:MAG: pyrimidine-nucleoside phosphorylase [Anaerocolumna sp.]|nr:pyrimidine-nucleoside phosphorylase [Anaerocolumna sp.]